MAEATTAERVEIKAQPGPQEVFLSTSADIAIYGGSAGGGKSFALLLEAVRNIANARFSAVIFRRTLADVKKAGSLLDTSMPLYGSIGGQIRLDTLTWKFGSGAKVSFGHLEHESTVLDWQGAQVPLICFDELTHFSKSQFFYLLSRNRSTCGVRPYIRATTNPDADSWVAEFIAWWIDQETGSPIPARAGKVRWFIRIADALQWGDSAAEMTGRFPGCMPKSLTFIPARLEDNAILMQADPGYRGNLLAMPRVERERLLGGNWKVKPTAGLFFKRTWCSIIERSPVIVSAVRGWDLAATPKTEDNDPDWTCGTKIGRMADGRFVVLDHVRIRGGPMEVKNLIKATAISDDSEGVRVRIQIPQDPAQSGKVQKVDLSLALAGHDIRFVPVSGQGSKEKRFGPFSAQAEACNVSVVRNQAWNEDWFTSLEGFPDAAHDDDVDSTSEAFNGLLRAEPDTSSLVSRYFVRR